VRRIALEEAKKSADGALDSGKPIGTNTNNVKYNTAFYGFAENNRDKAWCVVFIWWVMRQADVPATVFPKKASVFRAADGGVRAWFKARNRYMSASSMPKVGDLVVFKRSHIGIVERVDATRIFTVEGNASDRVRRRSYNRSNSDIDGYCHPAYDMVEEDDMTPEQATELKAILNRVNTIQAALTVEGTQTVDEGFQKLFDRVRNIEADVKEIKERIN
jgi:CHAP domain